MMKRFKRNTFSRAELERMHDRASPYFRPLSTIKGLKIKGKYIATDGWIFNQNTMNWA